MANSSKEVTLTSAQQNAFTTPTYLEQSHIKVYVNNVLVDGTAKVFGTLSITNPSSGAAEALTYSFTNSGAASINFSHSLPTGTVVRIDRNSSQDLRLVDYSDASLLTADTLDADANQMFFVAQEALDQASKTNLAAGSFYYSQGTEPSNVPLGTVWFDTSATPNTLKVYASEGWRFVAPVHETTKYTLASGIGSDSTTYNNALNFVTHSNFTKSSYLYKNGVKQLRATAVNPTTDNVLEVIAGTAQYALASGKLWFSPVSSNDVILVEAYYGSFSQEVTNKEASAQVAKTAAETAQAAAETAKTAAETAKTAAETAETNAAGHSSTASGHKDTATTQAGIATTKAGEAATSASTATTKASEAATSATNAANSATSASNTLANTVTLNTSQTISGAKVFSANADFGAGIDVTGTVTADVLDLSGNTSGANDNPVEVLSLPTNSKIEFDNTFSIQHRTFSDPYAYIRETGSGGLRLEGASLTAFTNDGTSDGIPFDKLRIHTSAGSTGNVKLYYGNESNFSNHKFETTSTGIDVTGEVKGDSLDIDGAVDIDTGGGTFDLNLGDSTATITTSGNGNCLVLKSTAATGNNDAPTLLLYRQAGSTANDSHTGSVRFRANNSTGSEVIDYGRILSMIAEDNDGSEEGKMIFEVYDHASGASANLKDILTLESLTTTVGNNLDVTGTVNADTATFSSNAGVGGGANLIVKGTSTNVSAHPDIEFVKDTGSASTAGEKLANLVFRAQNGDNTNDVAFAKIQAEVQSINSSGNHRGQLDFYPMSQSSSTANNQTVSMKVDSTDFATDINVTGTVTADGISVGDAQSIYVGAGNDLEIVHRNDGSQRTDILETGGGNLRIAGRAIELNNDSGTNEYQIVLDGTGSTNRTKLFAGQPSDSSDYKLMTTATGVDVKGTVTADALDIDGNATFTSSDTTDQVTIENTATTTHSAPDLKFKRTGVVGQTSNIGVIGFDALNSTPTNFNYANIVADATNITAGSETGSIRLQVNDPADGNNYPVPRLSVDIDGIDVVGTVTTDQIHVDAQVLDTNDASSEVTATEMAGYVGQTITFTASTGTTARTVTLPDAVTADVGKRWVLCNAATANITIALNSQKLNILSGASVVNCSNNPHVVAGGVAEIICVAGGTGTDAQPNYIVFGSGVVNN